MPIAPFILMMRFLCRRVTSSFNAKRPLYAASSYTFHPHNTKGDHRSPLAVFALPLMMRPTLFDFHSQVFQEGRHNIIALDVLGRASAKPA
jgi:hypothetical protein